MIERPAFVFNRNRNYAAHALLTAPVTVEKVIDFAFKGDIVEAYIEKDLTPGIYGFNSITQRDKFVSLVNASSEARPCVSVSLQDL